MARNEYLRRLLTPGADRWKPMLASLALFATGAGAAVLLGEHYWILSLLMAELALAAWVVGACAMIGYVRWFFAGELERAQQESEKRDARK